MTADESLDARLAELVAALSYEDKRGSDAEMAVVRIGSAALPALIEAAGSEDPMVRYRAAWAIGKIGDSAGFDTRLRLMEDDDVRVRYDAIDALGKLGDHRALEPVRAALKSYTEDDEERGACLYAMTERVVQSHRPDSSSRTTMHEPTTILTVVDIVAVAPLLGRTGTLGLLAFAVGARLAGILAAGAAGPCFSWRSASARLE